MYTIFCFFIANSTIFLYNICGIDFCTFFKQIKGEIFMKSKSLILQVFTLLLSAVMLLNGVHFYALASDNEFVYVEESFSNFDEPLVLPESKTSGDGMSFFGVMPEISESREVNWIDRIHNKPQYAVDFYDWLIENEVSGGALVSAHEVTVTDDAGASLQVHKITSFSDETDYTFTPGLSSAAVKEIGKDIYLERVDDDFYTAAEWISQVYCAFDRDHPEVFWLSGGTIIAYDVSFGYRYSLASGVGHVSYVQNIYFYLHDDNFDIRSSAYCSHTHDNVLSDCTKACSEIEKAIAERNDAVNKIVSANTGKTDYEKVKFLNEYLTKNNYYNEYTGTNKYSPLAHRCLSALAGKTGVYAPVCDGYAKAFKVLCDKMNIPCVLVDGLCDGNPHMWNYVQIDDVWYAIDVTRNDPLTSTPVKNSGYENANYLLVGSESVIDGKKFSDSHTVHDTVIDGGIAFTNEPLISKSSYNATLNHLCSLKQDYCVSCYSKRYDVNRDADINMSDLVFLKKTLLSSGTNGNLDCDVNGKVNSIDLVVLKKYFWDNF